MWMQLASRSTQRLVSALIFAYVEDRHTVDGRPTAQMGSVALSVCVQVILDDAVIRWQMRVQWRLSGVDAGGSGQIHAEFVVIAA